MSVILIYGNFHILAKDFNCFVPWYYPAFSQDWQVDAHLTINGDFLEMGVFLLKEIKVEFFTLAVVAA